MKKTFVAIAIVVAAVVFANAGILRQADLGPTVAAVTAKNDPQVADITYAAPSVATQKNCLTTIAATAIAPATLRVLSAGTTIYSVDLSSAVPFYVDRQTENALCAAEGAVMRVKVTTAAPGNFSLNAQGFVQ